MLDIRKQAVPAWNTNNTNKASRLAFGTDGMEVGSQTTAPLFFMKNKQNSYRLLILHLSPVFPTILRGLFHLGLSPVYELDRD